MLCFSVESQQSLENVELKWVGEIAENCPGVKLVLVALKCDLRQSQPGDAADEAGREANNNEPDDDGTVEPKGPMITYKEGLAVAERIRALRYLGEYIIPLTFRRRTRRRRALSHG